MPKPSRPPPLTARRLPDMVLVDRDVGFVDEVEALIEEKGGISPDRATDLGLDENKCVRRSMAEMEEELDRHQAEAEIAFLELRRRKAASGPSATTAARKVPITFPCGSDKEAAYFADVLEGTEPFLSEVAGAPGVTRFSIKYAWPPSRPQRDYPGAASIASCHRSLFLICFGNCRPGGRPPGRFQPPGPGFYMVYNTRDNSAAIVPRVPADGASFRSHQHVAREGAGGAVATLRDITRKPDDEYILSQLLLCKDHRGNHTNKATLFLWDSRAASRKWTPEEVVLPLPADEEAEGTTCTTSFLADMELTLSADKSISICWVDLQTGVLVYRYTHLEYEAVLEGLEQHQSQQGSSFHFIPLPKGCDVPTTLWGGELRGGRVVKPNWYRSMCCNDTETALRFVSMEGYCNQDIAMSSVKLTTWILEHPQSPTKWKWQLSQSVRIGDLWHNPLYNDLKPMMPCFPIISTQQHLVYLPVINYEYNHEFELMEASELYIIGIDMNLRGVVSYFKARSQEGGGIPALRIFPSDFTRYRCKTGVDLHKVCPKWEEVADEGESRSNRAAWASLWISAKPLVGVSTNPRVGVSPGEPNLLDNARRLGGHASSGGFAKCIGRIELSVSSISPVVGLQCVLDETETRILSYRREEIPFFVRSKQIAPRS